VETDHEEAQYACIIGGAALLTAAPFTLQWSQRSVSLSVDSVDARVGRPLTPFSVAGVNRRAYRRAGRSAVYAGAAAAAAAAVYGLGAYYGGYGYPGYSYAAPSAPYYGTGYGYGPGYGGYGSYYGGYGYPGYSTAPYNPGPSFGFGFGY
jgi:hypothetical protein